MTRVAAGFSMRKREKQIHGVLAILEVGTNFLHFCAFSLAYLVS
jgi:hypothetical protein